MYPYDNDSAWEKIENKRKIQAALAQQQMLKVRNSQPKQTGNGIPPMGMINQFLPGSSGGAGTAAGGGAGTTAGGGAGAGSGGGSGMAAAGPWAALAAAIVANETMAHKSGARSEDPKEYGYDVLTGDVLQQDINKRFKPYLGDTLAGELSGISKISTFRPKGGLEDLFEEGFASKLLGLF